MICACAPESATESQDGQGDETTEGVEETESSGSGAAARCGDGVQDPGEACDLGVGNEVGAECTLACETPRCGDGLLAPLEACDGFAAVAADGVGPWTCGDDCRWRSPVVWLDSWGDHNGHDDQAVQIEVVSDGTLRALGRQSTETQSRWFVRSLDAGGARLWERALGDDAGCDSRQPWLAMAGARTTALTAALTAALTDGCAEPGASLQVWDAEGEPAWSTTLGNADLATMGLWGTEQGLLVYTGHVAEDVDLQLRFIGPSGETIWEAEVGDPVWASAATDTTVYGAGPETLWARRLSDGALLQEVAVRSRAVAAELDGRDGIIVARRPSNDDEPFVLERYDQEFERKWTVDLGDPPNTTRRRFGVAVQDGLIALALEGQDPMLGSFDSHVSVHLFRETGRAVEALALQGPAHGRDFGLDVGLTSTGDVLVAGALAHPTTGLDGFVAQLDRAAASEPPYAMPIPTRDRPAPSFSRPEGPTPRTLFIDTLGPTLRPGTDTSGAEVECIDGAFGFPALSWDPVVVDEAVALAGEILEPFAVRLVTTEPPRYLPYTRVLVGGDAASLGSGETHRGLACTIDCGDEILTEPVFVFGEAAWRPEELAQTIAHEFGHAVGLDHVQDLGDLMNPVSSARNSTIEDGCVPLAENVCEDTHLEHCGPGQQDSYAELLAALGTSPADSDPPRIQIDAPASIAARDAAEIRVDVSDSTPGYGWQLSVVELGWRSSGSNEAQVSFDLNLPPGRWTLEVEASDQLGNVGRERAVVEVEPDPAPLEAE